MRPVSQQRTSPLQIDVQTQSPLWDAQPLAAQTVREAIGAAASALSTADGEVSILLTNDSAIRILNRDWRGIDKATNVLSFPASGQAAGKCAYSATSSSPMKRLNASATMKTESSSITLPISRCMVFFISSDTIIRPMFKPKRWKGSKAGS